MVMNKNDEMVLCVPNKNLYGHTVESLWNTLEKNYSFMFVPRGRAENDLQLRQIIPYFVFIDSEDKVFTYQRSTQTGEQRLAGKRSIGIGGHINISDMPHIYQTALNGKHMWHAYKEACKRELIEETNCYWSQPLMKCAMAHAKINKSIGMICLNNTPVNAVHLGFVHVVQLEMGIARTLHVNKKEGLVEEKWMDRDELAGSFDEFEDWSKHVLKEFKYVN